MGSDNSRPGGQPAPSRPNIILLVLDSVRAANLSCYGHHLWTTPTIDRLAKEGTVFDQAISVGCWTLPVHASLFTGLYPYSHRLTVSREALPANFPTLARLLKEAGYQTASFSNNAYVSDITGLTQGFDVVKDIWRVSNSRGTRRTKMETLIKSLQRHGKVAQPAVRAARLLQKTRAVVKRWRNRRDKGAQLTNEQILSWLTESRDPKSPFFLFANYMDCHLPYNPPYPYNRRFLKGRVSPWRLARIGNTKEMLPAIREGRSDDLEILKALYDGQLRYLDDQLGRLFAFIKSLGILNDTLVIITSDHGDSLGKHDHIGHRMALYEDLVRVPLIVRYPSLFPAGRRVTRQVSLIDLYPTLLEIAGVQRAPAGDGSYSLVRLAESEHRPFTVGENTAPKSMNGVVAQMIRTPRYKYIWRSDEQHELYDLTQDPGETTNVFSSLTDVARELEERLAGWKSSVAANRLETSRAQYDDAVLSRLRDLGYVE